MAGRRSKRRRRRRKTKQHKHVVDLPNDIILNILSRLPAHFLHRRARPVCKTWADLMHLPLFKETNFLHSKPVLLVLDHVCNPNEACFFEMREGKLQIKGPKLELPGIILRSSGGVLLLTKYINKKQLFYVANPVTMQAVELPKLSALVSWSGASIAYLPRTGELKVVCIGEDRDNGICHWYILTIGSNMSWRQFDSTVPGCGPEVCYKTKSISAGGVLYWRIVSLNRTSPPFVKSIRIAALDLGDESLHHLWVPEECNEEHCELLKMGNSLGCISWRSTATGGRTETMKIWLLKDLRRNEWAITHRFDLDESHPLRMAVSVPAACLENHQILIFRLLRYQYDSTAQKHFDLLFELNWKTGKWKYFMNIVSMSQVIEVHTDSLFSFSSLSLKQFGGVVFSSEGGLIGSLELG
ncbi:F-box-like domain-containing protein [Cephalotus follicularis]|uniref:F-box-like domain-containing protein n=1 Tax=Cephalotus follicularis TaxID=3775 RepID=A0A1Q3BKQ4_CEPFO|nr:F-box-like domain-containing protein [Cephalotus follicularis]